SLILALAGNAELQEHRGDRCQNQHEESRQAAAALALFATATEPETHSGNPRDGAGDGCGDGRSQYVVITDVRKLVCNYAFEFVIVHQLKQPLRNGNRSVARVAAGGEGVRRSLWNQVQ